MSVPLQSLRRAQGMSPGQVALVKGAAVMIGPGEWACGGAPGSIETLLGSCVCITLWHPRLRLGAACHYVLPTPSDARLADDPRFGSVQFAWMLAALRRHGADPRACEVKLFGGGRMFDLGGPDIGARNIAQADVMLMELGVAPVAREVGGDGYRRLRLNLADGAVWMRFDPVRVSEQGGGHG